MEAGEWGPRSQLTELYRPLDLVGHKMKHVKRMIDKRMVKKLSKGQLDGYRLVDKPKKARFCVENSAYLS